ncbi:MAG: GNAT family N-acetyltransferase, partial [Actinomycetota bacterium]
MIGPADVETDLQVISVDPCRDDRWAELARDHGGLFESPPWLASIRDAYGVRPEARIVIDGDGRSLAGMAAAVIDDGLGRRRSSLPFSDYTDPIGPAVDANLDRLVVPLVDGPEPFAVRTRRSDLAGADPRLVERGRALLHHIDLAPEPDRLWSGLAGQARQNVRRARSRGLTITASTERSALAEFHEMHVELRRQKYRMLAQPVEYFDALHRHLGSRLTVLTARHDGVAVAAFVLLRWGRTAYYKLGTSTPAAGPLRASDALMWHSIGFARDEWGCSILDLGLSDADQSGLVRFKAK